MKVPKLLTIAIPAYNMEAYLEQCLESVVVERYLSRLEVLVVNDGSQDATEEIALRFQNRYPDTFRVITKENGGWGSAVNRAIQEATGLYFRDLDSDDWFDKQGFESYLQKLEKTDVDLVLSRAAEHSVEDGVLSPIPFPEAVPAVAPLDFAGVWQTYKSVFFMSTVTYRTQLLQKNGIQLDTCYYTDIELVCLPMPWVKTVCILDNLVYIARVGRAGQSTSRQMLARHVEDIHRVATRLSRYAGQIEEGHAGQAEAAAFPYVEYVSKYAISAYFRQVCAIDDKAERKTHMRKAKAFYQSLATEYPFFANTSGYSRFSQILLSSNFALYPQLAALWRRAH